MKVVVSFCLFLFSFLPATAQKHQIVVLPFKNIGVSSNEAGILTNYTVAQIENLDSFQVYSQSNVRSILEAKNIPVSYDQNDIRQSMSRLSFNDYVTGTISKKYDRYIVDLTVSNTQAGEISTDRYEFTPIEAPPQAARYQQFLREESGLNDLTRSTDFFQSLTRSVPFQRLGGGLSLSYGSTPYYGPFVTTKITPISLVLDINLSKHLFMLLGGSYVMQSTRVNPDIDPLFYTTLDSASNSIFGEHPFYTAKVGLGARFWRVRLFSTYERTIAKDIDQSLADNLNVPAWFTTVGFQFYLFNKFYVGTELFFYQPVDYELSSDGLSLNPVAYGTTYVPALCIGFN